MAETKHTPGPWKAGYWGGLCQMPEHKDGHPGGAECKYEPVFYPMEVGEYHTWFTGIASEQPGVDVVWTEYDELKIRPADAALIAAAPEMLEALEAITSYFWGTEPPVLKEGEVQSLVESAISRARGAREGVAK